MVNTLGLRRAVRMALCALMLVAVVVGPGALPAAGQQDPSGTPGLDLNLNQDSGTAQNQQSSQDPVVTPTPVVGSTSGPQQTAASQANPAPAQQAAAPAGDSDAPIIAQGLIYLNGGDVIWQVREVELSESATATGNARIFLQRSGESIVRNDLTGKRARLETGEAYFASADDPYTAYAGGDGSSVVWIFEISNGNQVGEGAFYLSPNVTAYGEAVYDYEMARNVVAAGETSQVTGGGGPSLLVVLAGTLTVTADEGPAELAEKDGLIVNDGATVAGPNSGEAVYVTLTVGPEVSDESAAPPAPADTAATSSDQAQPAGTGDTASDQAQPAGTTEASGTTSQEQAAPAESAAPAEPSADTGAFVTSVQVGAKEGVGVTMYADGELVFDGWLEPGQWTDFYTGSSFEVYTTSGENTLFKNSCGGDSFLMGYETGDAHYFLEAGPQSCAPVG